MIIKSIRKIELLEKMFIFIMLIIQNITHNFKVEIVIILLEIIEEHINLNKDNIIEYLRNLSILRSIIVFNLINQF